MANGFKTKYFNEIKSEIEQSLIASLGAVNLMSPSVFASIVAIFAEREALIWQQVQAVYNSAYPNTAEGYSLDGVCALTGIIRESATYSTALCQLTSINYTRIPQYSELKVKNTNNIFVSTEEVTINNEKCCAINLELSGSNQNSYEITLNQKALKYNKQEDDDVSDIALGIVSILNDHDDSITATAQDGKIIITAKADFSTFSCFMDEYIKITSCTNYVEFQAKEKGAIAAPIGSLIDIHTPISGWIDANNLNAGKIGNNAESDQDLRARRQASIKLSGSGTVEAIKANLLNLVGVTAISINENSSNKIDAHGVLPHAFEALITGGDDFSIAKAIWQKKPAGIKTHGKISVSICDSSNKTQIINFSRPTKVFVYGQITITKTPHFNNDCLPEMQNRLIQQINKLGVGSNVILKALFLSIFSEQGISNAVVKLGGSLRDSAQPELFQRDVEIKDSEVALTDPTRIEIITEEF
jgi:uncharacterized phage protein gp47/JayE